MRTSDHLLEFVKQRGPILPTHAAKKINTNLLLASAHLAEMTAKGQLKVSKLKVGGSPLYYIPGQEQQLEKFHENLSEKEKKAYEILKKHQILKDNELEPVVRVALRSIKDFAVPLNVNYQNSREIFWKWHNLPNQKAEEIIKKYLTPPEMPKRERVEPKEVKKEVKEVKEPQQKLVSKPPKKQTPASGEFSGKLSQFFTEKEIIVIEEKVIRKNADLEFFIHIPSPVGKLKYFCKAKNKKRISDADLSNAFVKGQIHKLPVILISTGDLTKKAQDVLGTLDGLTFTKVK